jgi:hypothetical protein
MKAYGSNWRNFSTPITNAQRRPEPQSRDTRPRAAIWRPRQTGYRLPGGEEMNGAAAQVLLPYGKRRLCGVLRGSEPH